MFNKTPSRKNRLENDPDKAAGRLRVPEPPDISAGERKRERAAFSDLLLESISSPTIVLDTNGRVVFANRALQVLTGMAEEEILEGGVPSIIPEKYRSLSEAFFLAPPNEPRTPEPVMIPVITEDGGERLISWLYSPFVMEDGEVGGAAILGQDIAERLEHNRSVAMIERELFAVNKILSTVSMDATVEELLIAAFDALTSLPEIQCGVAYQHKADGGSAKRVAIRGFRYVEPIADVTRDTGRFPGNILGENKTVAIPHDDPRMDEYAQKMCEAEGLGGIICIPLVLEDKPGGSLLLGYRGSAPSEGEVNALQAVIEALSLGVKNVELRKDAEKNALEATTLLKEAKRSEERFRAVFEKSQDIIVLSDRNQSIVYANPAAFALDPSLAEPGALEDKTIFSFIHPEEIGRLLMDHGDKWETGEAVEDYVFRGVNTQGEVFYIEANSSFIDWPDEDALSIFVLKNITKRVMEDREREFRLKAEEALAGIVTRFVNPTSVRSAIRGALKIAMGLLELDGAFCLTIVEEDRTRQGAEELGVEEISEGAYEGKISKVPDLEWWVEAAGPGGAAIFGGVGAPTAELPPQLEGIAFESLALVPMISQGEMEGVLGFRSPDPDHHWFEGELEFMKELARATASMLERDRWIDRLGVSERFRTRITESIGEGLYVITDGRISWVNPQFCEMVGHTAAELIGSTAEYLLPEGESFEGYTRKLTEGLRNEGSFASDGRVRRKDGTARDLFSFYTSLGGAEDGTEEILCTVRDVTEAKRMQEKATAAAEAYTNLFSAAGDGMIVHTADGEILNANLRACDLTGMSVKELLGLRLEEILSPEAQGRYAERIEDVLDGKVVTFLAEVRGPGGRLTPTEVTSRVTRTWEEEVVLSAFRDITERHRAEEEKARRISQLESLNEIVKAATSSLDLNVIANAILGVTIETTGATSGGIFLENGQPGKKYEKIASIGENEELPEALGDRPLEEDQLEYLSSRHGSVILDPRQGISSVPQRISTMMERQGVAEALFIPLRNGERTIGMIGLGSVASGVFQQQDENFFNAIGAEVGVALENAHIYRELAAEHERLTLLHRSAQAMSVETDLDFLMKRAIEGAAAAVGATCAIIALEEPDVDELEWRAAQGLDVKTLEGLRLKRTDGIGALVMQKKGVVGFPMAGEDTKKVAEEALRDPVAVSIGLERGAFVPLITGDRIIGIMLLKVDRDSKGFSREDVLLLEALGRQSGIAIQNARLFAETTQHLTALEAAHRELMVLDRMKSDFVSTVSHELRSPLTVIEGFARTLVARYEELDPKTIRESLDIILKKSISLEGLISIILDMSMIEEGRLKVASDPVDLRETILRVKADQEDSSDIHAIIIEAPEGLFAMADQEKTEMVISNLVRNAIKFSPQGGEVRIEARRCGDFAEIAVKDEGIGVANEELTRIFDRFYQVEGHDRRFFQGTGLGLYVTRELVRAMGGAVAVESAPRRGSTFSFTLPLAES